MTRAEQAALKAYPKEEGKVWTSAFGTFEFDRNAAERKGFQEGYEQAEKDLLAIVKEYMEKGDRCMQQAYEDVEEDGEYAFWDGFHNCAENILRELEK